jgi:uracil-DNA glycosylase
MIDIEAGFPASFLSAMMLDTFIETLAQTESGPHVWNQYSYDDPCGDVRRANLRRHWQRLLARQPKILLLGEAVGYRGGRLTGLPFVSEAVLMEHALFGEARGFVKTAEWPTLCREATATIMWQTLDAYEVQPVLWNVFPFHPHRPDEPASNRKPNQADLGLGEPFVRTLLTLFPISTVVAVGKTAEQALCRWQINCVPVRHPSHGGKRPFQAGLTAVLDEHARFC